MGAGVLRERPGRTLLTVLYLDTSSLLKTCFAEPESGAVDAALSAEQVVVISPLTELESLVQVRARWLGGALTGPKYRRMIGMIGTYKDLHPFVFRSLTGPVFATALRQHGDAARIHCRSLDRLHLAAMEELGITRLMTHDIRQAEAARALGFEVVSPSA